MKARPSQPAGSKSSLFLPLLVYSALLLSSSTVYADEGFWPIDNFPSSAVEEKYGVTIDQPWLERAQLSSARLSSGCSSSFSSDRGLILTNYHCMTGCVRDLSTNETNLSEDGFYAETLEHELTCPGLSAQTLIAPEDVTTLVQNATEGLSDVVEARAARQNALDQLASDCEEASNGTLACETVSLYQGGQYYLYKYKRYDDIRLVFVPEQDIATFGGDPDNFNFPRWSLDMAFIRAYNDDGTPALTPNFLKWKRSGPSEREPVFVSGHPGSTNRGDAAAALRFQRDYSLRIWINRYYEYRGRLLQWANTGQEAERVVRQEIPGLENALKLRSNQLKTLAADELLAFKDAEEEQFIQAIEAVPALQEEYGDALALINQAYDQYKTFYLDYLFVELGAALTGNLFWYARQIVRGTVEREKSSSERLPAYSDTSLPRLERNLLTSRPISKDYEELGLAFSLEKTVEWLGPDSPYVKEIQATFDGLTLPKSIAAKLVNGTKLDNADYRQELWEGEADAVRASDDSMILMALQLEEHARSLLKRYLDEVKAPLERGEELLAMARFALYTTSVYPDATSSLRISYGAVEGWIERGETVDPMTKTERLFERATGDFPFKLPEKWVDNGSLIDPSTPFNFVSTADVTGGNSGSPVLGADGNLVGLLFDGNIHTLSNKYWYDGTNMRSVSVHPTIMLEAMEKVYGTHQLLEELSVVEGKESNVEGQVQDKTATMDLDNELDSSGVSGASSITMPLGVICIFSLPLVYII